MLLLMVVNASLMAAPLLDGQPMRLLVLADRTAAADVDHDEVLTRKAIELVSRALEDAGHELVDASMADVLAGRAAVLHASRGVDASAAARLLGARAHADLLLSLTAQVTSSRVQQGRHVCTVSVRATLVATHDGQQLLVRSEDGRGMRLDSVGAARRDALQDALDNQGLLGAVVKRVDKRAQDERAHGRRVRVTFTGAPSPFLDASDLAGLVGVSGVEAAPGTPSSEAYSLRFEGQGWELHERLAERLDAATAKLRGDGDVVWTWRIVASRRSLDVIVDRADRLATAAASASLADRLGEVLASMAAQLHGSDPDWFRAARLNVPSGLVTMGGRAAQPVALTLGDAAENAFSSLAVAGPARVERDIRPALTSILSNAAARVFREEGLVEVDLRQQLSGGAADRLILTKLDRGEHAWYLRLTVVDVTDGHKITQVAELSPALGALLDARLG